MKLYFSWFLSISLLVTMFKINVQLLKLDELRNHFSEFQKRTRIRELLFVCGMKLFGHKKKLTVFSSTPLPHYSK
ncbi:hypothetical protein BSK51_21515 [Paenibacillus odorifer]|uniref:Uncharacterized protein n=1 Tax=Paenibacillus odorifer TaxID=189426 RepID=A0ABX3HEQ0_9BACL|nr:hypothetical protein BSK51_21515 [Paenibacillus odorifer]